jgi:hypothetical protein
LIWTWQLHPPPPVHRLPRLSVQDRPEQHVRLVAQVAPMPSQVGGATQLVAPPSGLSQVSPLQHGAPEVCEHDAPLEMQTPASA